MDALQVHFNEHHTLKDDLRDCLVVMKELQPWVHQRAANCDRNPCPRCDEERAMIAKLDEVLERIGGVK